MQSIYSQQNPGINQMQNFNNNQQAPMAYTTYDKNNQNINLVA